MRGETARRLVRLYPRAWRERYEEEFVAMLEQGPGSARDVLDVVIGALDAWLRPQASSERRTVVVDRMRNSVLVVLWAWVGLVAAGVGFQKMAEYEDFVRAAQDDSLVGAAYGSVVIGAVLALVAVVVGGVPVVFAALRRSLVEGRKDVRWLLLCAPLPLAGSVGYALLIARFVYPVLGPFAVHDPANVVLFLSLVGALLLAAAASAGSVSAAVVRSGGGESALRFALYPATVAALAMVLVSVGTAAWGVALRAQAPGLFAGDDGVLATPTAATWLVIVAAMAVSTAVAVAGAARGLRVRRTARSTGQEHRA